MRTRPEGLIDLVNYSLANLPEKIHIKQFTPVEKYISWGLLEYDTYNFKACLQRIPSTSGGEIITNAMYVHGGSKIKWKLPSRCVKFTTKIVCMDTGISQNIGPVVINGRQFQLNDEVLVDLKGHLEIITQDGPGSHIAFLTPSIEIDRTWADLPKDIMNKLNSN
jgi:hypothetical protein